MKNDFIGDVPKGVYENLNKYIQNYIDVFCKKHDIKFEYWIADQVGEVAAFGDFFFSFHEIRHDLETAQPKDKIFEWYERNITAGPCNHVSYCSYVKGAEKITK